MSSLRPQSIDAAGLRRAANRLAKRDPRLAGVLQRLGPPPLWKRPATFATFVRIILEQQVSLASAKSTLDRIRNASGGRITPVQIAAGGEVALRRCGASRQKARYIITLADDVLSGDFRIGSLRFQSDQQVRQQITARLGLGNWSADVFLLMALCRRDVLPIGDLALLKGLSELDQIIYDSPEQVLARAEDWRPDRSTAARMLWQLYLHNRQQSIP